MGSQWGPILKKLDSLTLETSKDHLIRNFLRNGGVRVKVSKWVYVWLSVLVDLMTGIYYAYNIDKVMQIISPEGKSLCVGLPFEISLLNI